MVCALLAAQRGMSALLLEGQASLGGGVRTRPLTLDGFHHDVCSAVHPFGRSSPVLRSLGLESEGLEWIDPVAPVAHPMIGEEAVVLNGEGCGHRVQVFRLGDRTEQCSAASQLAVTHDAGHVAHA